MKRSIKLFCAATAFGAIATSPAGAATAVIGDTISATSVGLGLPGTTSASATVTAGNEFTANIGNTPLLDADFSQNLFKLSLLGNGPLEFPTTSPTSLSFADVTNPFTGASLVSREGTSFFSAENFSVIGGVLNVNLIGTRFTFGSSIVLALTGGATTPSGVPAVPETATWAMMLLGFGGIGAAMRRRTSTGTAAALA